MKTPENSHLAQSESVSVARQESPRRGAGRGRRLVAYLFDMVPISLLVIRIAYV